MVQRRDTAQQRAIRDALNSSGRPLSVDEIHQLAIDDVPSLGVRTVYRVVERLLEDGEIASVAVPRQPDRYELASVAKKHHHHFHCDSCDRVFDVQGCPGGLSRMLPDGFTLAGHELTLWGTCPDCA
ncbi:MAG: transcriptional repressor [Phycisphaera sp.]|nr:MAG: transcriptional repressor [Phycisphaera sp.]